MSLRLSGSDRKRLREILLEGFDRTRLVRALGEASSARDFENLVSRGPFSDQVFELIQRAESEGWLDELRAVVESELPQRADLQAEVGEIFSRAQESPADSQSPPDDAARPEAVRSKTLRFTFLVGILTALCITAGAIAYTLAPAVGIWTLPAALLALLVTLIVIFLTTGRRGESPSFLRGGMRIGVLATLLVSLAVNGLVLHRSWRDSEQPNFIVRVIEADQPVAKQKVDVARATQSGSSSPVVEVTNPNGEAFFRLAVGSDRIYLGGVEVTEEDKVRRCQFPAFTLLEARSITHDLKQLHCSGEREAEDPQVPPGEQSFSLRIDPRALTHRPVLTALDVPRDDNARGRRAPLGLPKAETVLDRRYYTLGYDRKLRAPRFVAFTVDAERTLSLRRSGNLFRLDPDLPADVQSSPDDYKNNPYDRGNLVRRSDALLAAGGEAAARAAEREVFYYSVIVPQPDRTNRVTWLAVEAFTTDTSQRVGPIHVLSGPVYASETSNLPYLVIGPGRTPVPIALYRVLLRKTAGGHWRTLAFLVPNDGSASKNAREFATTIDAVEAQTGLDFLPELDDTQARALESQLDFEAFITPDPAISPTLIDRVRINSRALQPAQPTMRPTEDP